MIYKSDTHNKHLKWIQEKYAEISFMYVDYTSRTESIINDCISTHFIRENDNSNIDHFDLMDELVVELTMRLPFKSKFAAFQNIIRKNYNDLFLLHEDDFKEMTRLYGIRNRFSHSFVFIPPDIIVKLDKKRIAYLNMSHSINQPQYVSIKDYEADLTVLESLLDLFFNLRIEIKKRGSASLEVKKLTSRKD